LHYGYHATLDLDEKMNDYFLRVVVHTKQGEGITAKEKKTMSSQFVMMGSAPKKSEKLQAL
jgi:hypothetical protein